MRRILAVAVVVLASWSQADAQGPGPYAFGPGMNPEMNAWWSNWSTIQNARRVYTHTPATVGLCYADLHEVVRLNPPVITYTGLPWPNDKTVFYPPAYREAKYCLDWLRFWPVYQP